MGDFAMNFAFADGNLALCEQLRQKGEKLKFSHKDIRQALLDGRLDIILWLEKWYRKKWEYYCRNYYPLPNAIMGGNIGLVQKNMGRFVRILPRRRRVWFPRVSETALLRLGKWKL
ncbi:hypothetical protein D1R32_gp282 [Tunisvirus fontaine2]|uniref:Ankyrin repeat-containing protein n=1 Tax=Tunisvirus fontaine2 TaxID=1421067 RepID=V9SGI2_9VIRU|nr:hypothetical protein D1R32_gp282 [Tunisvirus fontaine2]AHC54999.1 hypothetical protein TNS_ORF281 [Tunisvirus fontaine2]